MVLVATVVLMTAGIAATVNTVATWIPGSTSPPAARSTVDERAVSAIACQATVDYLSWDSGDRSRRASALERLAAPSTTIDGWDGTGRQRADTPVVVGLTHDGAEHTMVTVRTRVTAWSGTPSSSSSASPTSPVQQPGGNPATAPDAATPAGMTALPARWVTISIPLGWRGGRWVVTARPALVAEHTQLAVVDLDDIGVGDAELGRATRDTATKMLAAFASGDLEFIRATGATVVGLDRLVTLYEIRDWRIAPTRDHGPGGSDRQAGARVVWELPGGAKLTCAYLLRLHSSGDRWALSAVLPASTGARL